VTVLADPPDEPLDDPLDDPLPELVSEPLPDPLPGGGVPPDLAWPALPEPDDPEPWREPLNVEPVLLEASTEEVEVW
jgi:hypothetical protein